MTEQSLPFDAPAPRRRRPSLTDRLEAYLLSRVGELVTVKDMETVVGNGGGVRQRRLECEMRGVWLDKPGTYDQAGRYGFIVLGKRPAGWRYVPGGREGRAA